jgi:hypothetical protein
VTAARGSPLFSAGGSVGVEPGVVCVVLLSGKAVGEPSDAHITLATVVEMWTPA